MSSGVSVVKTVILVAVVLALAGRFVPDAPACDYVTLRDAAFDEPRDLHWLCVIANEGDPAGRRIHDRLARWFEDNGGGLNIELRWVAADDPDVDWKKDYGIKYGTPPPSVPVVVLVGRRRLERTGFFIDYWEPAPTVEQLNALKSSPVTDALQKEVVRKLAVVLYVPGTGESAGAAKKVLDSVVETWSKKERLGVSVVPLDRSDSRERLLLSFAGVSASGLDWVAVVFGPAKFMPPLEGEEITEAALNELIGTLMGECTCLRPPAGLGVDIPMTWDASLDDKVLWLYEGEDVGDLTQAGLPVNGPGHPPPWPRMLAMTMWTLGFLVVVISVAAAAILWRRHRVKP